MLYTDESLDFLRLEGDPLADKVIAELMKSQKVREVNRVLRNFHTKSEPVPAELPTIVQEYLQATTNPPSWADATRIKRAHAFFLDDGLNVSAMLSLGALVGTYAVPHGAKLLAATQRLDQPKRRVADTGQFCMYLTEENAFGEDSKLIPTIQKVRLIHAAVRYLLISNGKWSVEQYGVPICQEDMLGALLLFSLQVIEGLKHLELPITAEEAEDYYYVWRVAGVMLGIREEIIPETIAECYELNDLLKRRHIGYSPEGVQLTHNLIKMYQIPCRPNYCTV